MRSTNQCARCINRLLPSSMRYGHFRYYWLGMLAGVTGHQMLLSFTLGWLMFELTGEERDLAFLGIAVAVPALLLNMVGGVLADRLEPKIMVAVAQSTSATVVILLAMLVLTGRVEPWHLLVSAVVIGAVQAFDQPSRASVFPRLVEREHIVNAVAMTWSLGPLGMAQAGFVAQYFGAPIAVAAGAVVIIVVALLILFSSSEIRALTARMTKQLELAPAGSGDGG